MERPKTPYQEITTLDNADIHGQLKDRTWEGLQFLRSQSRLLELSGFGVEAAMVEAFHRDVVRTSGSIEGKHRESTTAAVQGQKPQTVALGIQQPQANGQAKPVSL